MREQMVIVDRVLYGAEWDEHGNSCKAHHPGEEIPLLDYERLTALKINKGPGRPTYKLPDEDDAPPPEKTLAEMTIPQLRIRAQLAGVPIPAAVRTHDAIADFLEKAIREAP